jgi:hypothetical protein
MSDAERSSRATTTAPRWAPPSPVVALVPGVVMVFAGIWMVTGSGSLPLGWAFFSIGQALLVVGAVAWGVAWGMDLHAENRP